MNILDRTEESKQPFNLRYTRLRTFLYGLKRKDSRTVDKFTSGLQSEAKFNPNRAFNTAFRALSLFSPTNTYEPLDPIIKSACSATRISHYKVVEQEISEEEKKQLEALNLIRHTIAGISETVVQSIHHCSDNEQREIMLQRVLTFLNSSAPQNDDLKHYYLTHLVEEQVFYHIFTGLIANKITNPEQELKLVMSHNCHPKMLDYQLELYQNGQFELLGTPPPSA